MLRLYRSLLALYPAPYRHAYADEMLSVLAEVELEAAQAKTWARISLRAREVSGLLGGALTEHTRAIFHGNDVSRNPGAGPLGRGDWLAGRLLSAPLRRAAFLGRPSGERPAQPQVARPTV